MTEQNKNIDKIDKVLDIKGEVCPYTFVRSKLALEDMESGQVLKVIVDHEPATRNVPRSMENEGNKVLDISKINDTDWQIIVKKG
ncbi:MAG: sulfurtransferase TusA family protein [Nitrospinae bacterium]|nr:sulfurtransferase TusA family protein [Nitrospinota bacterium]